MLELSQIDFDETAYYPYSCELRLEVLGTDNYRHHVFLLPPELKKLMPFPKVSSRLRVAGEIGEVSFKLAWQPMKDGRHYLLVNPKLRRDAGLREGGTAHVRFKVDNPDAVDVPAEIRDLVDRNRARARLWEQLTPGRRRGIAYWVSSARGLETRQKRARTVFDALKVGVTSGQEIAKFGSKLKSPAQKKKVPAKRKAQR